MTTNPIGPRQAIARLNAVIARIERADLQGRSSILESITAVDEAIALFNGPESEFTREVLIAAAKGFQVKGNLYCQIPMLDDALDAYQGAENFFVRAGGDSEDYGRFLHDFSIFIDQCGIPKVALEYAKRSREVLIPFGRKYARKLDPMISRFSITDGQGDSGPPRATGRRGFSGIGRRAKAETAQARAIELIGRPDARLYADEIADSIRFAYDHVSRRGSVQDMSNVLLTALNMYFMEVDMPDWVVDAAAAVAVKAEKAGRVDLVSDALTVRAARLDQQGQVAEALATALRAIARRAEHMLATESSMFRQVAGQIGSAAQAIALELAVALEDGALAAELIESARLQVEPDNASPLDTSSAHRRSRVRGLRPVSVNGVSRLAGYYSAGLADLPLPLEAMITAIGGERATWWGTWGLSERIFWALFVDGRWTCGVLRLAEGTGVQAVLSRLREATMQQNPRASALELITGELSRNVAAEELLSVDLGEVLVPPELRQRLLEATRSKPISLVIAGDLVALVPLPLLALRTDLFGRPVRIVEAAVLRVAPPAILVERAMKSVGHEGHSSGARRMRGSVRQPVLQRRSPAWRASCP